MTIEAHGEAGLYYGSRTLLQLLQKNESGLFVRGMVIRDWPDIPYRAVHYDTKHHQDKDNYVKRFIRQLADYKINMLVWEKARFPKGLSLPGKSYFHQQDRARHFALRKVDMSFLIYDELLLGLEEYLAKLQDYIIWYKNVCRCITLKFLLIHEISNCLIQPAKYS